jgi:hypothetical protein
MTFTVLWSCYAEAKLANLWLRGRNRQAISDAADKIDDTLRENADTAGESRTGDRRVFHEPPLGVMFSVDLADRKVLVLDVWQYDVHDKQSR